MHCLKCGDTGVLVSGERCDCQKGRMIILPTSMKIPVQYQGVVFQKDLVRPDVSEDYGIYMEELLDKITENFATLNTNILICAPPNSGKTIWAYTAYGTLFKAGIQVPELMDIMQARELLVNYYVDDKSNSELLSNAPVVIIKLPMDLPNKFPETMSSIIERRVRNNGSTIFMFNGEYRDLEAQDRFGKLKHLAGDGSFNSLLIKSFK